MIRNFLMILALVALVACSACNNVMGPGTDGIRGDDRRVAQDKNDDVSPAKEELSHEEGGGGGGDDQQPVTGQHRGSGRGSVAPVEDGEQPR